MTINWPTHTTDAQRRHRDEAWAALVSGAESAPATCECGAPITEDRGATDALGNAACYACEMDTLAREQRWD